MNSKKKVDEDLEEYSERYIRWHGIQIEQMGFVNNLLIGLTSGALVWLGDYLLIKSDVSEINVFFVLSPLIFAISLVLGFLVAWNRLKDFQLTTHVLHSLVEKPPSKADKLTKSNRKQMRDSAKNLGETSWVLLRWQIVSFGIGLLFTAIAVICQIINAK